MKTTIIIYLIINLLGLVYDLLFYRPTYRIVKTTQEGYTIYEIEELQRLWLFPLIKMYVGGIDEGHQTRQSAWFRTDDFGHKMGVRISLWVLNNNNNNTMETILRQFWCLIINTRYPSAYCFEHWVWYWDCHGNVRYDHLKTLINLIKSKL